MSRLTLVALAAVLGLAVVATGAAQGGGQTAPVEVRVWQNVGNLEDIRISARPAGGSWRTLGTIPLPLGETTDSGTFAYADIDLDVALPNRVTPATVEVRVWQRIGANERVYISARPAGGDWGVLGTIRLLLDDGFSSSGTFRFGDIGLDVPLLDSGVTTLAGQAHEWGYADGRGDEVRFAAAGFSPPYLGLAVDHDGSVVVADRRAIRRILPDGTVTTIAGGSTFGSLDGPAETARFQVASDVAIDPDGSIYVADGSAGRIRKITPDGVVATVAGGDPPEGERSVLGFPSRLALAPDGNLYVIDHVHIRRLAPSGQVSTFAGGGGEFDFDGPRANVGFVFPRDIDVDAEGNVYVLDGSDYADSFPDASYRVRKVSADGWVSTVFQGHTRSADGLLVSPGGLAVTAGGEVYLTNTARNQIVRVAGPHTLEAVAGTGTDGFLDGDRDKADFSWPGHLALAPSGALVVTDQADRAVRVVSPNAEGRFTAVPLAPISELPRLEGVRVRLLAGRPGVSGYADGAGEEARFRLPRGVALDATGAVIVADAGNDAVRRVSRDGIVTTLAGGNGRGSQDGPGDVAQFDDPVDVALGPGGFIYVVDKGNGLLRRVGSDGAVSPGSREEDAILPQALASGRDGALIVSEGHNQRILRIAAGGAISSVLPAGIAKLHHDLAVDAEGSVFWVAAGGPRTLPALRRVDGEGAVTTLIEERPGRYGGIFSLSVSDLAVTPDGMLYLADRSYRRVLQVSPAGEVSIVASWGRGHEPAGILVTPDGALIVVHIQGHAIYEITFEDEALE